MPLRPMTNPKGIIMLKEISHLCMTLKRTTLTVIDSRACDSYRVLRGKEKRDLFVIQVYRDGLLSSTALETLGTAWHL